jgi:shikimate kinase
VHPQPAVLLIGPPAAGKSRVGRKVASFLELPFIDTDSAIVREHGPIADIFASRGEAAFRALERDQVSLALRSHAVVSLGGGAVLDPQTQESLRGQRIVLLTVSPGAVEKRITGTRRPLLASEDSAGRLAAWSALSEARRPIYESLATKTWDTSRRPVTVISREIADWVMEDMAGSTGK